MQSTHGPQFIEFAVCIQCSSHVFHMVFPIVAKKKEIDLWAASYSYQFSAGFKFLFLLPFLHSHWCQSPPAGPDQIQFSQATFFVEL